ncbi:MAG: hypothetical protein NWE90_05565 [Candidatus Bathyarchaeota archaeon]|nr:hypothetical protein [Candidatus Bathyarchaeota archaeon]
MDLRNVFPAVNCLDVNKEHWYFEVKHRIADLQMTNAYLKAVNLLGVSKADFFQMEHVVLT